jgi:hypothetical protein
MIDRSSRALLRKDLPWLVLFVLVGGVPTVAVAFSHGFERVLLAPDDRMVFDLGLTLWIQAVVLGMFAALHEDVSRTRPYLVHRAVTPRRLHWTRALGCLLVVASWPVLAVLTLCGADLLFGARLGGLDARTLPVFVALTAQAVATFALTVFAASLPVAWWLRPFVAAIAWLVVHLSLACLATREATGVLTGTPVWDVTLVALAFTAVFLLAAARHERVRHDADHPLPSSVLLGSALVVLLSALCVGAVCVTALQKEVFSELRRARPEVALVAPGELRLVRRFELDGRWQEQVVDAEHRATGVEVPRGVDSQGPQTRYVHRLPDLLELHLVADQQFDHFLVHGNGRAYRRIAFARGGVEILETDYERHRRRRVFLSRPDGRAFSSRARAPSRYSVDSAALVGDPADGTVWRLTGERGAQALEPLPLPDGDRFIDFGGYTERNGNNVTIHAGMSVIRGQRSWRLHEGGLVAVDGDSARRSESAPDRLAIEAHNLDVLTPEATFRALDGATLRHRFALHTGAEKFWASLAMALTVLRPPPAAVASAFADPAAAKDSSAGFLLDVVLLDGRRALLALNLLLHALLAYGMCALLRRRGASKAHSVCSALGTALGGFLFFPFIAGVETRRAYARPVAPAPRQPLLIESA